MLLLLIIPLGLLWLLLSVHRERLGFGNLSIRGALVLAFLAFEVLLLAITELSSVGNHFRAGTVAVAWLIVIVVLLFVARTQIIPSVRRARLGLMDHAKRLSGEDWLWIAALAVIFGLLMTAGFLYRPSYGDSMIYHLARVEHWIQNGSIAFFATHYTAQLEFSPLSEYNLAHLHLLAGTDRFDACVALVSALVCMIGVSELARLLGASRSTQIAASVICATVPSGIMMATSTDNDYLAAAAGLGVVIILASFSLGSGWGYRASALGAALGLSYMAKSTMTAVLAPTVLAFLAVAVFRQVRKEGRPQAIQRGIAVVGVIGASTVAVVGIFLAQTYQLFNSFVGPQTRSLISSPITIAGFGANIDRATAANFEIGNGVAGLQTYVSKLALGALHHVYSVFGVSLNDPHYAGIMNSNTFAEQDYSLYQHIPEFGANPWDILLAVLAVAVLLVAVARGRRQFRIALLLSLSLCCGYLLLTGTGKWEPFDVRFQVPFFVAMSAVIAVALSLFPRWVTRFVLIGLVLSCLPQLLDNREFPLVPQYQFQGSYLTPYFGQYGSPSSAEEAAAYQTVTTMLAQSTCKQAGIGNWVGFEYPLWVGLQHEHYQGVLNDFNVVSNASWKLEPSYRPCASITQQGPRYFTPNNGTVNVQQSILVLSMNPRNAATIRTSVPHFESNVRGVRLMPGGGWNTGPYGLQILGPSGSVYVFSDSAQPVQLRLHLVSTIPQPTVHFSEGNGQLVSSTIRNDTVEANLDLRPGITRINMIDESNAASHRRLPVLTGVTLGSAGT